MLAELKSHSKEHLDAAKLQVARSRTVDELVVATAVQELQHGGVRLALGAVGGYGRSELFPHSDIDLLILVGSENHVEKLKEPLAAFLRILWDSGLRISQSVRTIEDCCRLHEQNTELNISLLDVRYVWGDTALYDELSQRLSGFYRKHEQALLRNLRELTRQRHSKFNNTVYHLEPNVKESPGGIRDLHLLHWMSRLMPQQEAIGETIAGMQESRDFLHNVRCWLHLQAGRDQNLLSFDSQDQIAESNEFHAPSAAEWMRIYYRHARRIFQGAVRALELIDSRDKSLLLQFRDWRSRLSNADFTVSQDRVYLRNPGKTLESTQSILQLFVFLARHGLRLSWDAQRRISAQLARAETLLISDPPKWPEWHELLSQKHVSAALSECQETGLLTALFPEWKEIDSLVVRDFYHRYTVDEHTLVAIGVIDELANRGEDKKGRFLQLAREVDDLALLRLALLLHDVGKGTHPGEHVAGSLEAARTMMNRMEMPAAQQEIVLFLIAQHLDLSEVMSRRDLDDPATGKYLARRMGTVEKLRLLTLLTFADISAVNPTAMTPWRRDQLWRVYLTGQEQLTRELEMDRIEVSGTEVTPQEIGSPIVRHFLNGLPTRYLRTHDHDEIARHAVLAQKSAEKGIAAEIIGGKDLYTLTVITPDRPALFATICGTLSSFGFDIVKAEAFANAENLVVDQFRFTDPLHNLELNPSETAHLRRTIERSVLGSVDVKELLKRRRPARRLSRTARILSSIRFDNEASEVSTLVDFTGEDRPGLLYELSSVLSAAGCNIEVVLIDTEAHKALDVFYVTRNGKKLDQETQDAIRRDLLQASDLL